MSDPSEEPSKPIKWLRRWYQFSLRSLIVFSVISAIIFGWIGSKFAKKRHERALVIELVRRGARVWYDDESDDKVVTEPGWLESLAGEKGFSEVVKIDLFPSTGDDELALVGEFAHLKWLGLLETKVTDKGLQTLARFRELEGLGLGGANIGDDGIAKIRGLTHLRKLILFRTKVTDAGLANLEQLSSLEYLDLSFTDISDAGLIHLEKLSNLAELNLDRTKVSDAGIPVLKTLTNLEGLGLHATDVSIEGAKQLRDALPRCSVTRF